MKPKGNLHEGLAAFSNFRLFIRGLAAVSKEEVEAEEAKWKGDRAFKKKRESV